MISRIFLAALFGGVLAGLALSAGQQVLVVPLILDAEVLEVAASAHDHGSEDAHDHEAWAPEDGSERTFYTVLSCTLTAIGFALMLSACYALRGGVTWRSGILWGLAGFAAFQVAPALGLPPELPGADRTAIELRQIWWISTALATAGGIAILVYSRRYWKATGVVLLVAPHVWGAPVSGGGDSLVPDELLTSFIYTTIAVNAVFWILLGTLTGWFFNRMSRNSVPVSSQATA